MEILFIQIIVFISIFIGGMKTSKYINKKNKHNEIDPKYINVPNISFSLYSKNDDREKEYSKQRIERGFDDSETWCLTTTFCKFFIPRLKRYDEIAKQFLKRDSELEMKINKFIKSMELFLKSDVIGGLTEKENKDMEEGIGYFPDIFFTLWW
jgi:hypothetical protein